MHRVHLIHIVYSSTATSRPLRTSALHLSIAFENSSNPVIRTAVATTLNVAERQDPARVAEERIRIRVIAYHNYYLCGTIYLVFYILK